MDSLETTGTPAPEQASEQPQAAPHTPEQEPRTAAAPPTLTSILERAREIVQGNLPYDRHETEHLKLTFARLADARREQDLREYAAQGGQPEEYVARPVEEEAEFRKLMQVVRERRAKEMEEQEHEKQVGLARKLDILAAIQQLITTPEEATKHFEEFKHLTAAWKEVKAWPADRGTELWKSYQLYTEQFYDLLKMGHELREYDFRKNLDIKTRLCEQAEALAREADVVAALQQLQLLHQEWKETGPVAKDVRETIWARFKEASAVVRKAHQAHFEQAKERDAATQAARRELCQQVETLDFAALTGMGQWAKATEEVKALQARWRELTKPGVRFHRDLQERFSKACDEFFAQKSAFWQAGKEAAAQVLERKKELVAEVETLRDSTDWRATATRIQEMRKQWAEMSKGVPRSSADNSLYRRFSKAADHFFGQKQKATSTDREEQKQNLETKRAIIQALKELQAQAPQTEARQLIDKLRELQLQWNAAGRVPMKELDAINAEYRAIADDIYQTSGALRRTSRFEGFKKQLAGKAEQAGNALTYERKRLAAAYDNLRAEILTYENNLGFLSVSSKKGNSLVGNMQQRMEKLRGELDLLAQKIRAIDQEIKKSAKPDNNQPSGE